MQKELKKEVKKRNDLQDYLNNTLEQIKDEIEKNVIPFKVTLLSHEYTQKIKLVLQKIFKKKPTIIIPEENLDVVAGYIMFYLHNERFFNFSNSLLNEKKLEQHLTSNKKIIEKAIEFQQQLLIKSDDVHITEEFNQIAEETLADIHQNLSELEKIDFEYVNFHEQVENFYKEEVEKNREKVEYCLQKQTLLEKTNSTQLEKISNLDIFYLDESYLDIFINSYDENSPIIKIILSNLDSDQEITEENHKEIILRAIKQYSSATTSETYFEQHKKDIHKLLIERKDEIAFFFSSENINILLKQEADIKESRVAAAHFDSFIESYSEAKDKNIIKIIFLTLLESEDFNAENHEEIILNAIENSKGIELDNLIKKFKEQKNKIIKFVKNNFLIVQSFYSPEQIAKHLVPNNQAKEKKPILKKNIIFSEVIFKSINAFLSQSNNIELTKNQLLNRIKALAKIPTQNHHTIIEKITSQERELKDLKGSYHLLREDINLTFSIWTNKLKDNENHLLQENLTQLLSTFCKNYKIPLSFIKRLKKPFSLKSTTDEFLKNITTKHFKENEEELNKTLKLYLMKSLVHDDKKSPLILNIDLEEQAKLFLEQISSSKKPLDSSDSEISDLSSPFDSADSFNSDYQYKSESSVEKEESILSDNIYIFISKAQEHAPPISNIDILKLINFFALKMKIKYTENYSLSVMGNLNSFLHAASTSERDFFEVFLYASICNHNYINLGNFEKTYKKEFINILGILSPDSLKEFEEKENFDKPDINLNTEIQELSKDYRGTNNIITNLHLLFEGLDKEKVHTITLLGGYGDNTPPDSDIFSQETSFILGSSMGQADVIPTSTYSKPKLTSLNKEDSYLSYKYDLLKQITEEKRLTQLKDELNNLLKKQYCLKKTKKLSSVKVKIKEKKYLILKKYKVFLKSLEHTQQHNFDPETLDSLKKTKSKNLTIKDTHLKTLSTLMSKFNIKENLYPDYTDYSKITKILSEIKHIDNESLNDFIKTDIQELEDLLILENQLEFESLPFTEQEKLDIELIKKFDKKIEILSTKKRELNTQKEDTELDIEDLQYDFKESIKELELKESEEPFPPDEVIISLKEKISKIKEKIQKKEGILNSIEKDINKLSEEINQEQEKRISIERKVTARNSILEDDFFYNHDNIAFSATLKSDLILKKEHLEFCNQIKGQKTSFIQEELLNLAGMIQKDRVLIFDSASTHKSYAIQDSNLYKLMTEMCDFTSSIQNINKLSKYSSNQLQKERQNNSDILLALNINIGCLDKIIVNFKKYQRSRNVNKMDEFKEKISKLFDIAKKNEKYNPKVIDIIIKVIHSIGKNDDKKILEEIINLRENLNQNLEDKINISDSQIKFLRYTEKENEIKKETIYIKLKKNLFEISNCRKKLQLSYTEILKKRNEKLKALDFAIKKNIDLEEIEKELSLLDIQLNQIRNTLSNLSKMESSISYLYEKLFYSGSYNIQKEIGKIQDDINYLTEQKNNLYSKIKHKTTSFEEYLEKKLLKVKDKNISIKEKEKQLEKETTKAIKFNQSIDKETESINEDTKKTRKKITTFIPSTEKATIDNIKKAGTALIEAYQKYDKMNLEHIKKTARFIFKEVLSNLPINLSTEKLEKQLLEISNHSDYIHFIQDLEKNIHKIDSDKKYSFLNFLHSCKEIYLFKLSQISFNYEKSSVLSLIEKEFVGVDLEIIKKELTEAKSSLDIWIILDKLEEKAKSDKNLLSTLSDCKKNLLELEKINFFPSEKELEHLLSGEKHSIYLDIEKYTKKLKNPFLTKFYQEIAKIINQKEISPIEHYKILVTALNYQDKNAVNKAEQQNEIFKKRFEDNFKRLKDELYDFKELSPLKKTKALKETIELGTKSESLIKKPKYFDEAMHLIYQMYNSDINGFINEQDLHPIYSQQSLNSYKDKIDSLIEDDEGYVFNIKDFLENFYPITNTKPNDIIYPYVKNLKKEYQPELEEKLILEHQKFKAILIKSSEEKKITLKKLSEEVYILQKKLRAMKAAYDVETMIDIAINFDHIALDNLAVLTREISESESRVIEIESLIEHYKSNHLMHIKNLLDNDVLEIVINILKLENIPKENVIAHLQEKLLILEFKK